MTPTASEPQALADLERLRQTWRPKPGLLGWLSAINHQEIGRRYILTAFVFLLIGGAEALLMRVQLAGPENTFLSAGRYNQIFTLHGTTMMFLFAVPVMEGMGIYLVPLMIGTRNVAFPRLNAFGYWIYLAGGLFLYGCALFNMIPDAGWFAYPPLSGPQFSPGKGIDVWAQMITFTEIAALITAIAIITTLPRPPRIWPTRTRASVTSRCEMPPVSISPPARMKSGIARSGKLEAPEKRFSGTTLSEVAPVQSTARMVAIDSA